MVLAHARRIRRELELLHEELAALQGLQVGNATFGVVGTASRWLVPAARGASRERRARRAAARARRRVRAAARRARDRRARAGGRHRAGATTRASCSSTSPTSRWSGSRRERTDIGEGPFSVTDLARYRLVLPPAVNPLRIEIEAAAARRGVQLDVPVEVEGIRLIADLVAAGAGIAVLPETAVPPGARRAAHLRDRRPAAAPARVWRRSRTRRSRSPTARCATRCSRSSAGPGAGRSRRVRRRRRERRRRSTVARRRAGGVEAHDPGAVGVLDPDAAAARPRRARCRSRRPRRHRRRRAGRRRRRPVAARSGLPSTTCRSGTGSAPRRGRCRPPLGLPTARAVRRAGSTVGDRARVGASARAAPRCRAPRVAGGTPPSTPGRRG